MYNLRHLNVKLSIVSVILAMWLVGCQTTIPNWYQQREYTNTNHTLIGYGIGNSQLEARESAISEIASALSTQFSQQSQTVVEENNGETSYISRVEYQLNTHTNLHGLTLLNQANSGNKYYVVYQFDKRTTATRMVANGYHCAEDSSYLYRTAVFQKLEDELGCVPQAKLIFHNNYWALKSNDYYYPLEGNSIAALFSEQANPYIKASAVPHRLVGNAPYSIHVSTHQAGYLSLFTLSDNGELQDAHLNLKVNDGFKSRYPDPARYEGLRIAIPEGSDRVKEMIIATLCDQPIVLPSTNPIQTNPDMVERNQKNIPLLFNQISQCNVSTTIVHALAG
ncbi:LPP20 family lipoprotein [Vibrio chaetopteri]|uniref:LPP20 family lipoprotein n=1 Tax=Vibrio chaetopteri TaxID=3016528 RepID=UPI003AB26E4C